MAQTANVDKQPAQIGPDLSAQIDGDLTGPVFTSNMTPI